MSREELLKLIESLGKAFRVRKMDAEVKSLRAYYAALRGGQVLPNGKGPGGWSQSAVVEWLKTLRVQPFAKAYELRSWGAQCPVCRRERQKLYTQRVFPGGARICCITCNSVWVQDEATPVGPWMN